MDRKFLFTVGLCILMFWFILPTSAQTGPTALPDFYTTALNTPTTLQPDILANDSISASLVAFDQPVNGSVTENAGILTYTPNTGFVGLDSFTYTITDGTANALGKAFIEVGNPSIDVFQIAYGDTISDGVPGTGAGNIEVVGAQDVYVWPVKVALPPAD